MAVLEVSQQVRLHWRVDGAGPRTWLLFNGASLALSFWDPIALALARTDRVLRLDARNAGGTQASGEFSLLDLAADAARLLDHLGVDTGSQRLLVAGHAFGGRVAQVFARDWPHRVRGLAICGTGGQVPATVPGEGLERMREAARVNDRAGWALALEAAYCAPGFARRDPAAFEALVADQWDALQARRANADSGARWDPRIAPSPSYWGTARVPALLVYGTEDRNGTRENALDLQQRIPGARLHFVADAGHFVIRERPAEVLAHLQAFAVELDGAG